jgi:hypothetical protein
MNTLKCTNCGLVNFPDVANCKRCNYSLQAPANNYFLNSLDQPPSAKNQPVSTNNQFNPHEPYKRSQFEPGVNSGKYFRKMLFGALWAIGGTIATFFSYSSAAGTSGGGKYFIFWGAILFGLIDCLVGFSGWVSNKD